MKSSVGLEGTPHRSLFWRSCCHHTYCAAQMDLAVKGPTLWCFEEISIPFLASYCWFRKQNTVNGRLLRVWEAPLTTWPVCPVGGSFFVCWISSETVCPWSDGALLGSPMFVSPQPSFIFFSQPRIWVFPTFIFDIDPVTEPSHF